MVRRAYFVEPGYSRFFRGDEVLSESNSEMNNFATASGFKKFAAER